MSRFAIASKLQILILDEPCSARRAQALPGARYLRGADGS